MIYVMGSLTSKRPMEVAAALRREGHDVFDDWHATHPLTDTAWQTYEQDRGHSFAEALRRPAAQNVFQFDKQWLDRADMGVLVLPAGKSGHLELGYLIGQGKPGFILLHGDPEKWDVMYQFATGVAEDVEELLEMLTPNIRPKFKYECPCITACQGVFSDAMRCRGLAQQRDASRYDVV